MNKPVALITGATSGIGRAFAERFAARGYDLILTGRRREVITSVAREIKKASGVSVTVIIAELTEEKGVQSVERVIEETENLEVLVNNAGFGMDGEFIDLPVSGHLDMLTVHVAVPIRLMHAALPRMIENKKGTIINVASLGAFTPAPINGIYGGTKSMLVVLSESLHLELRRKGITVQALCPGFTRTDFHAKMGVQAKLDARRLGFMTPDNVVDASLKAIRKGKVVCIPGIKNKFFYQLVRFSPRWAYYRVIELLYRKYLV